MAPTVAAAVLGRVTSRSGAWLDLPPTPTRPGRLLSQGDGSLKLMLAQDLLQSLETGVGIVGRGGGALAKP